MSKKYVRIELVQARPLANEGPAGGEPVPGYEVTHADGRVVWLPAATFGAIHVAVDGSRLDFGCELHTQLKKVVDQAFAVNH